MSGPGLQIWVLGSLVFVVYFVISILQFMIWQGMTVAWFFTTDIARFVVAMYVGYFLYSRLQNRNSAKSTREEKI